MYEASSEARKQTAFPISSGCPILGIGIPFPAAVCSSSVFIPVNSDTTAPGATAFTRIR